MAAAPKRSPYIDHTRLSYAGEPRPRLTGKQRIQIVKYHARKWLNGRIAAKIGCHWSTVADVLK